MKLHLLMLVLFFQGLTQSAHAEGFDMKGVKVSVAPIVGYSFDHSDVPSSHVRSMLIYGARVTAGFQIISAEGEYTRGNSSEIFTSQTIKTEKENVRLGLRATKTLISFLNASARLGGQASRQKIDDSVNGISNVAWKISPYAGAGIEGIIGSLFSITADVTYVFNDLSNFSKNDYQTTLSLRFNLGSAK